MLKELEPPSGSFLEKDEKLVGQPAKRQAVTNPEDTIFAVKRFIEENLMVHQFKKILQKFHKIIKSENGDAW